MRETNGKTLKDGAIHFPFLCLTFIEKNKVFYELIFQLFRKAKSVYMATKLKLALLRQKEEE